MRREAPEDVLLGADLADVQTVGVQVVDLAERAVAESACCSFRMAGWYRRMWPTIRIRPVRVGQPDELFAVPHVDGERLLDEHVFAGLERRLGHLVVRHRRRGQSDRRDRGIGEDRAELAVELDARVLLRVAALRPIPVASQSAARAPRSWKFRTRFLPQ